MNNPAQPPNAKNPIRTSLAHALTDLQSVALIAARQFAIPLLLLGAGLMLVQPCAATPFQWEYTGSLNLGRERHTATLLSDGKVLVVGGDTEGVIIASAELYDPATGNWTFTGSLNTARYVDTATLLSDGRVLVAGGYGLAGDLASAELYDPATGTWTFTGSLVTARGAHTATLLPNGKVLVAGGIGPQAVLASAKLYNPATGTWTLTGSLNTGRAYHTATLLPNGKVLVAGGEDKHSGELTSTELYDPATGTWTFTGSRHTLPAGGPLTLLFDGRVLAVGLYGFAELYDPATGIWTLTGSLITPQSGHTATLLSDGRVLVAGGNGGDSGTNGGTAELYDPPSGTWTLTGSLNTARYLHTATLLPNGKVLVAAGYNLHYLWLASAELYDPGIVVATQVQGRGVLDNQGNEVTFMFSATQAQNSGTIGHFNFCDPVAGVCITNAGIRNLSITGNSARFSGGQLQDGTEVKFKVSVTDNGSPGTSDTISIILSNGYSLSGTLIRGDILIY